MGLGLDRGLEVGLAPGRLGSVHADDDLAVAIAAGLHGGADLLARDLLGVGRDRVLEVENQAVGRQLLGLVERALVGARHVEDAAAKAEIGHQRGSRGVIYREDFLADIRAARATMRPRSFRLFAYRRSAKMKKGRDEPDLLSTAMPALASTSVVGRRRLRRTGVRTPDIGPVWSAMVKDR